MCLYADQISQQCSQHQAGRAEFSFFDLGTGVLLELVLAETALELWWVELIGLEPVKGVFLVGLTTFVVDADMGYEEYRWYSASCSERFRPGVGLMDSSRFRKARFSLSIRCCSLCLLRAL